MRSSTDWGVCVCIDDCVKRCGELFRFLCPLLRTPQGHIIVPGPGFDCYEIGSESRRGELCRDVFRFCILISGFYFSLQRVWAFRVPSRKIFHRAFNPFPREAKHCHKSNIPRSTTQSTFPVFLEGTFGGGALNEMLLRRFRLLIMGRNGSFTKPANDAIFCCCLGAEGMLFFFANNNNNRSARQW